MSVFADEWRKCLREQYKHVVRNQEKITESSLKLVLNEVGFSENELSEMYVEATMRADAMPDDYVPDLEIVSQKGEAQNEPDDFQPHPLECQCPACVEVNLRPHDAEGQPIEYESEEELAEILAEQEDNQDDSPHQLTMF